MLPTQILESARRLRRLGTSAVVGSLVVCAFAASADAEIPAPVVNVVQQSQPTYLTPGGVGTYAILVQNLGGTATVDPVAITDTLPPGVTATEILDDSGFWSCPTVAGSTVVDCTMSAPLAPGAESPSLTLKVQVDPGVSGSYDNVIVLSGAGGATDTSSVPTVFSPSPAPFGIAAFSGWAVAGEGVAARQAGSHPDLSTTFSINSTPSRGGGSAPAASLKDVTVDLPPGLVGNPTAAATCRPEVLADVTGLLQCPRESQVGTASITGSYGVPFVVRSTGISVYNVDPPVGSPARFGFSVTGVIINIDPVVRTGGDYGITAKISDISQTLAITDTTVTLWGVPADPSHDALRGGPSTARRTPFITAPTSCTGSPLSTRLTIASWQDPGTTKSASTSSDSAGQPLVNTGCDALQFDPKFSVVAESSPKTGAPVGIGVDLTVPQNDNPDGLATANLKTAKVTLPEGMVVNPSSAAGLEACTPAQVDLNGAGGANCPSASKIGTVDIDTPLLKDPLTGGIYLAAQRNNPFGTTVAIYIAVEGSGVVVKLPGRIDMDPKTGRVTAEFDNNPQVPFEKLSLHFKTGPRAPLALPKTCGPATTTAVLTPWSGTPPVTINTTFNVSYDGNGKACPPAVFSPTFIAGTANPVGGADSAFTLGFSRSDDDQELSGVTVNMPRGLLARISSTTLCPEAQANAGTCGDGSKIGTVRTAAGAGSNPFELPGRVYITGPYKGGPFGLSIVVPAVAGPFNLGTVVVRAAIYLDPNTAELRIVSDPLPTILEGIPLQIRLVEVKVDRPGFTINPTNCTATRVGGQLTSTAGAIANVASRFQVGDCGALPYKPKMTIKVGARGKLTRGKRTPLDVTLEMTRGQANNRSVQVTLPKTINARLDVVNRRVACTAVQYAADRCPMVVGQATATTPLLRDPLRGPAYFVYNPARRLPDLVVRLKGQVAFDLVGKVTITRDLKLQTTFDAVPDVPITKFRLVLASGSRNGPVGLTGNVCLPATRKALRADLALVAQSSRRVAREQTISVVGCSRASARRAGRARRGTRSKK